MRVETDENAIEVVESEANAIPNVETDLNKENVIPEKANDNIPIESNSDHYQSPNVHVFANVVINTNVNEQLSSGDEDTETSLVKAINQPDMVESCLFGNYLTLPNTPKRKGKRNTERLPFAISSQKFQEMHEKKRALQIETERQKEEKRRKLNEKRKTSTQKNNKLKCFVCGKACQNKTNLKCEECTHIYHKKCVPKSHRIHIPDDDDAYLCHNCYKEEEMSSENEPYKDSSDENAVEQDKYVQDNSTIDDTCISGMIKCSATLNRSVTTEVNDNIHRQEEEEIQHQGMEEDIEIDTLYVEYI